MADSTPKSYHTDPTLYLYTSLTSGSSHIISATSRMQTILKANKVDFQALDVATDEKARMLWGRRAGKRKLPGLVRFGMIVGDLEEVEEWNEYGELKENVNLPGPAKEAAATPTPSAANTPSKAPAPKAPPPPVQATADAMPSVTTTAPLDTASTSKATSTTSPVSAHDSSAPASAASTLSMAMRQAGFEAAKKAGEVKAKARQEELERLKAKSVDTPKPEGSGPSDVLPSNGTTKAESTKKPEGSIDTVADDGGEEPSSKDEKKEEATANAVASDGKIVDQDEGQLKKAANEEIAKASNEASTGAAEPEVLEGQGQAESEETVTKIEPVSIPAVKQSDEPTKETGALQILNAKEAEEEANKAIIADESTHVHIAGSPPPHAIPGMKYPGDDGEETNPLDATPEGKDENKELGKLTKEKDDASKVDVVEVTGDDANENETKTEPAAPIEREHQAQSETTANTENEKKETSNEAPVAEDGKENDGKAEEPTAATIPLNTETSEDTEDATKETENTKETTKTKDTIKQTQETISKPETSNDATSKLDDPKEPPEPTQTAQPTIMDEQPQLPGTKTQDQPAADGEKAGESVAD